jgi:hypothetical protein
VHGNVFVHPSRWHKARQFFFILKKGRELLSQNTYDLIVSHDYGFFYNGFAVWRLSRQSGIPYVSEIHHVEGYPRAATLRQAVLPQRSDALYSLGVAACQSHPSKPHWIPEPLRRQGVPKEKILVLPRSTSTSIYSVHCRTSPNATISYLWGGCPRTKVFSPCLTRCTMLAGLILISGSVYWARAASH